MKPFVVECRTKATPDDAAAAASAADAVAQLRAPKSQDTKGKRSKTRQILTHLPSMLHSELTLRVAREGGERETGSRVAFAAAVTCHCHIAGLRLPIVTSDAPSTLHPAPTAASAFDCARRMRPHINEPPLIANKTS